MNPIFVYGTLRPSLYPHRKLEGAPAQMEAAGWKMVNVGGKFPALVPSKKSDDLRSSWIVGEVIQVGDFTELDTYEGCKADGSGLYARTKVTVRLTGTHSNSTAWVYYMTQLKLDEIAKLRPVRPISTGDWADELGG